MPHFITDLCIGCTICARKCPVHCIAGDTKNLHVIDPDICIDCGVCGIFCPVDAIENSGGSLIKGIKQKDIPRAKVNIDQCTGCVFCVDICPEDCISMSATGPGDFFPYAIVDEDKCVSCKLCETVCIKDAITVDRNVPALRTGFSDEIIREEVAKIHAEEDQKESA